MRHLAHNVHTLPALSSAHLSVQLLNMTDWLKGLQSIFWMDRGDETVGLFCFGFLFVFFMFRLVSRLFIHPSV